MRLWSERLIPHLCDQHLLGLHREVCGLRGKSWDETHETVDYALNKPMAYLYAYHKNVMIVLESRGVDVGEKWREPDYRGKQIGYDPAYIGTDELQQAFNRTSTYPEHNDEFTCNDIEDLRERSEDPEHGCECDVESFDIEVT